MTSLLPQPLYTRRSDGVLILAHRYRLPFDGFPEIPRGFEWDGASVPAAVERAVPGFTDSLGLVGPLLHDYLYRTGGAGGRFTRRDADRIFHGAMLWDGVNEAAAAAAHHAVRIGAFWAWKGKGMNIAPLLPIAKEIAAAVLGTELVNKAIDRYVAGTETNKWDDAVWHLVEGLLGIDHAERPAIAQRELERVQAEYDAAKLAGEVPAAPVG